MIRNFGWAVDDKSRILKAKMIICCLEYVTGTSIKNKNILEVGAGSALISHELAKLDNYVVSVDINDKIYKEANLRYNIQEDAQFLIADGRELSFKAKSFDIIICNQVIEHVPIKDHRNFITEMNRILKSGGLLYISTPNKFWFIEPHAKLPFLSYMPKSLADKYIKFARGEEEYDINLLTYNQFVNSLKIFEITHNLTPHIIKNPDSFKIENKIPKKIKVLLNLVPLILLQFLMPICPSWILIGRKNEIIKSEQDLSTERN
jgi:2-polyprenyl-3-methyl-5-hydroxy-6-metoxy-1,4-benzoquinol methylase